MTRKALMLLATVALMVVAATAVAAASTPGETQTVTHIRAHLAPVGGSGVHGTVTFSSSRRKERTSSSSPRV